SETHVDRSIEGPAEFVKTNVLGTQVLLDAALKHQKRFHHISTDEVFGSLELNSAEKFHENSPYDPSSPYSASKSASDHLVRAYVKTFGLKATITNCSNNYGPYQFTEKFIPLMITNALKDKKLPIYGDGLNVRDWIYVEDHNKAVDLVIQKGNIGETYLVGGNCEKSNLEVVKMILNILGKPESLIEFVKDRPGHDRRYAIDSGKIEKELGWKRDFDFDQGLLKTIDWYKNNV
ncbi:MAG TPA: dTDP-glucose 4,6-dehydratase, partial [Methylomirabilota bacterium]|nr:dTDP-glucose 4,6-dehydratase [Methylomirabilota bacterium]